LEFNKQNGQDGQRLAKTLEGQGGPNKFGNAGSTTIVTDRVPDCGDFFAPGITGGLTHDVDSMQYENQDLVGNTGQHTTNQTSKSPSMGGHKGSYKNIMLDHLPSSNRGQAQQQKSTFHGKRTTVTLKSPLNHVF